MNTVCCITTLEELLALKGYKGLLVLSPRIFQSHAPDMHLVLIRGQEVAAHCSLWWKTVPEQPPGLGLIGHYAVQDAAAASELLASATQQLAAQGCTMAIAPIDGNTWRRYRFVIDSGASDRSSEPPFFLEPGNPVDYPAHYTAAGFTPLAHYSSALNSDLTQSDPRLEKVQQRMQTIGVTVRSLDLEKFEQELQNIHLLSLISFRHNFLYTPIDQSEFMAQYRQVRSYIRPELVLLAEQADRLVGFLFAIPDLLQPEPIQTVIIKTVAILPGRPYAGLGNLLVAQAQAIAHQLGYRQAIHALMHEDNPSRNLSQRYAKLIRRYALFAKPLRSE